MRALLLCLALLAAPVAAAEDEGSCIHRSGTGITVTREHCLPSTSDVQERVQDELERPPQ